MTYEDVKRIRLNPTVEDCDNEELSKMIDAAIEKQIPKKPTHEATLYKCFTCPTCKNVIDEFIEFVPDQPKIRVTTLHCKYCGQALDWSDAE